MPGLVRIVRRSHWRSRVSRKPLRGSCRMSPRILKDHVPAPAVVDSSSRREQPATLEPLLCPKRASNWFHDRIVRSSSRRRIWLPLAKPSRFTWGKSLRTRSGVSDAREGGTDAALPARCVSAGVMAGRDSQPTIATVAMCRLVACAEPTEWCQGRSKAGRLSPVMVASSDRSARGFRVSWRQRGRHSGV